MKPNPYLCTVFSLAAIFALTWPAHAMKCGNRLVSVGDSKGEVLAKCGEPFHADFIATETGGTGKENVEVPVEQWTYNQGPKTFLQVLTFRAGQLVKIESGARVEETTGDAARFMAVAGDTQAEILQKYGPPQLTETLAFETTAEPAASSSRFKSALLREEKLERWTYNLGPGTFLQLLTFRGGKLIRVENGDRQ